MSSIIRVYLHVGGSHATELGTRALRFSVAQRYVLQPPYTLAPVGRRKRRIAPKLVGPHGQRPWVWKPAQPGYEKHLVAACHSMTSNDSKESSRGKKLGN